MLQETKSRSFANGIVYALQTEDDFPIEVTDTFLPFYTKDAIGRKQNRLSSKDLGDRSERWMIGVSVCSGCPVRCKFCATGQLKKWRPLTAEEIVAQIDFVLQKNPQWSPTSAKEFKINYTRMGDFGLNQEAVQTAIRKINERFPNTHHYISTIGIRGSDFSWIQENISLQFSIHSLKEEKRDVLIPYRNKMSLAELGQVRTRSNLKTTLNLTLVDPDDFDIQRLRELFDPEFFFVKLSPLNPNAFSDNNELSGIIKSENIL